MCENDHLILAIESSSRRITSVAVGTQDTILAYYEDRSSGALAESLAGWIEKIMSQVESAWPRLQEISVSIGPGSYTGLRIGIAAAKGIAVARNVGIRPVSTFHVVAEQWLDRYSMVLVLLDAGNGNFFGQYCALTADGAVVDQFPGTQLRGSFDLILLQMRTVSLPEAILVPVDHASQPALQSHGGLWLPTEASAKSVLRLTQGANRCRGISVSASELVPCYPSWRS